MGERKYDLEDRLLDYSVRIIRMVEGMSDTRAAHHVGGQLLRAGTSPFFNHGESESAESPRDFVHKLKICLKELRESRRALRLVEAAELTASRSDLRPLLDEADELIRIFVTSIKTATKNRLRGTDDE